MPTTRLKSVCEKLCAWGTDSLSSLKEVTPNHSRPLLSTLKL